MDQYKPATDRTTHFNLGVDDKNVQFEQSIKLEVRVYSFQIWILENFRIILEPYQKPVGKIRKPTENSNKIR